MSLGASNKAFSTESEIDFVESAQHLDTNKCNSTLVELCHHSCLGSLLRVKTRRKSKPIFTLLSRSSIIYQRMKEDNDCHSNNWPEGARRGRSKSLPTSSLFEAKTLTGLKARQQVVQQQPSSCEEIPLFQPRNQTPLATPFLQMGIEILTNSAKDIELEKKRMEYVLEKQKRLQDDFLSTRFARNNRRKSLNIFFGFATDTSSETSVPLSSLSATPNQEGTFTKWKRKIHTKVSSGKNLRTAEEGHKRATKAMNQAGDWIMQMGDSLQQEELRLRKRAQDLRRVSVQAFKLMSEVKKDDQECDDSTSENELEKKQYRNSFSEESFNNMQFKYDDDEFDDTFYGCIDVDEEKKRNEEKFRRHSYLDDECRRDILFDLTNIDALKAKRTNSDKVRKKSAGFSKNKLHKTPSCPLSEFELVKRVDNYCLSDFEKRASVTNIDSYLWSARSEPQGGFTTKDGDYEALI